MSRPVFLIPDHPSHDVVKLFTGLMEMAQRGELTGAVLGLAFKGQRFYCESAGSLHRNPAMGLSVAAMLVAEMERRIPHEAHDTVI